MSTLFRFCIGLKTIRRIGGNGFGYGVIAMNHLIRKY